MELQWLGVACRPPSETVRAEAAARQLRLTKPAGSLGRLEHVAIELAAMQGRAQPRAERIPLSALLVGVLWWALAMALVVWAWPGAPWWAAVLGALTGLAWMWRLLRRRLQGFTGDGLGATQQLSELAIYLALAARL